MDHQRIRDLGFLQECVEDDEETPHVVMLVEPEGIQDRPQVVHDEQLGAEHFEPHCPLAAPGAIENVERRDAPAQRKRNHFVVAPDPLIG
jgi:hypothetical protein